MEDSIRKKHFATWQAIFRHPTSANIRWKDVEALFVALGATIEEREGSRVAVIFPGEMATVFHAPHPSPKANKGAIKAARILLEGYQKNLIFNCVPPRAEDTE